MAAKKASAKAWAKESTSASSLSAAAELAVG
jgi:hypothetical protein